MTKTFKIKDSKFKIIFLVCLFLFSGTVLHSESKDSRQPAVAGQFYPDNPKQLSALIDEALANVPEQNISGSPIAILVPHAGYVYSAQTAAYAFKLLENLNIDTVVLIGNSHNFYLERGAVYVKEGFLTPLGEVPVNTELAKYILSKTSLLNENNQAHGPEHSLEVELPFLQKTLKSFTLVPILLGRIDLKKAKEIGKAIADSLKEKKLAKKSVLVISSDMSHYPSWANANMVDNAILKTIKYFDPERLASTINSFESSKTPNLECAMCGKESLYTGMYAAKALGADKAVVLNYSNSAAASGDKSRVVGYGAVVFVNAKLTPEYCIKPSKEKNMGPFAISEKNQKELLKLARQSIQNYLSNGKNTEIKTSNQELLTPSAVFVTLTKNGQLRGCIGTTVAQFPLWKAVSEYAVAAAVEDPRFNPVDSSELNDIKIEISVLSPMKKISNPDEIKQNTDGVVVKKGFRSGLFLPQVWEHFSNKEDFMNELCWQKAGLEPDAWRKGGCDLYTFTVFAFEEHK